MFDIFVDLLSTEEVSVAVIEVEIDGAKTRFDGWAKKHPKDPPNRELGAVLAFSRALTAAAQAYSELAFALVDDNSSTDDVYGFSLDEFYASISH